MIRLLHKLPEPMACVDRTGKIVWHNDAFAAVYPAVRTSPMLQSCLGADPEKIEHLLRIGWSTTSTHRVPLSVTEASGALSRITAEVSRVREDLGLVNPPEDLIFVRISSLGKPAEIFLALNQQVDRLNREIRRREQLEQERHALLEAEREARAQLEAMSERKNRFISLISHELRSPLNAIMGWLQLLRMREHNDAEILTALDVMQRNAEAQAALIQEIVDYERLSSGKLSVSMTEVNLSHITHTVLQDLVPAVEKAEVRLITNLEEGLYVRGDSSRLSQVIRNLIENALKFTPPSGSITISLDREGSSVVLQVVDTGTGIPGEALPLIFNRFYQADSDSNRKAGGLGLGLSIVKMLTELQGGSVVAASEGVGKGSKFEVRLPLLVHHERSRPVASDSPVVTPSSLQGRHILVVDDLEDARMLLEETLARFGATVTSLGSTAQALGWLATHSPDIVVSDIEMPDEDGYTLVRKLRALNDPIKRMPVIALTAHARPEDRERSLAAGFDSHMTKPVNAIELVAELSRLLRAQSVFAE
jgi:signal transduction histidine kinase/ActR/RegA family two-component response regulator